MSAGTMRAGRSALFKMNLSLFIVIHKSVSVPLDLDEFAEHHSVI